MRSLALRFSLGVACAVMVVPSIARADAPSIGVAASTLKVRPSDAPSLAPSADLKAARNEVEAFQIVVRAAGANVADVSASLSASLTGPRGAKIPDANVTLYAERYYDVGVPSNDEGAKGLWPDPLVPDVDTYVGQKRNAFPFTVPAGENRVVWVDVLVPIDQAPGDYSGEIRIAAGAGELGRVAVKLHVGNFTLPSTATLASAYGMSWNGPPLVHCGGSFPFCKDEDAANAIRAMYLRAGLDHRITITPATFQPPFGSSKAPFETHVLPLVDGTGPTRLPGAKLTTVQLDAGPDKLADWIAYAKAKGFFDRLFYYPTDEPGNNAGKWSAFESSSQGLHAADADARICLTASMQDAQKFGAENAIDVFVPVLDQMWGRPGSDYAGNQRSKYDAWLSAKPNRRLWMYQSCDQHGCGACGEASPGADYTGWPERVIDSSGVQDRAFAWIAWLEDVSGELYFAVDNQLATAWDANGQCAFSGSGDGTIFYPGKTSIIGGTTDIPVESIRLKLIREGMEDFEYLAMVAKKDPMLARSVAQALFPSAYECAKKPADLDASRDKLFSVLDVPVPDDPSGGAGGADADGRSGRDAAGRLAGGEGSDGGCACGVARPKTPAATLGVLGVAIGAVIARAGSRARRRSRSR